MDGTEQKYLEAAWKGWKYKFPKIHATQQGADYTYCGCNCIKWPGRKKAPIDSNIITCRRCLRSLCLL